MSEQNELALVLSRIQALSKSRTPATGGAADAAQDGIPVLTDIYQGQDAFTAVELDQLFAPYYLASESQAPDSGADAAQEHDPDLDQLAAVAPEPETSPDNSAVDSSIRFLPVEDDEGDAPEHPQPVREELVAAVLADIQPVMSDVIRQALLREVQVLGPRLSAELESALSASVRQRVQEALKDEPAKE